MSSIVLIFPYFGTLPVQYKMWHASALRNESIHFLFFTDTEIVSERNIKVVKCTFDDFRQLLQEAFDFPILLDRPYKLCEYKPAYGFALQKYICDYDFWGFGDLDLVYGDIRSFFTERVLARYKMFLGWGHLTLFRNDEDTNSFFMKKIDGYQFYKDAFTTSSITFFDEYDHKGTSDKWKDIRKEDCWLETPFDNVSKPKQSFHFNSLTRGWKNVVFEYNDGKLYMTKVKNGEIIREESLYAHFQHRKFMRDKVTNGYSHFLVTPTSIINYPKHLTHWIIKFYCRDRTIWTQYHRWKDRIVYKLKTILRR